TRFSRDWSSDVCSSDLKREFPDGRDLNRVFPGSVDGSLASRVAHKLIHDIVPYVDCIIDFHTGGSGRFNAPQIRISKENRPLNRSEERRVGKEGKYRGA